MIELRKITADDSPLIIAMRNLDEVRCNLVIREDFTLESQAHWFEDAIDTGKAVQYIILWKGTPVGSVYINNIDRKHANGEFGIFIGVAAARGQGIGTDAAKEITRIAFEELGLHRVYLRVFPENVAAVRSYEKAGFFYEGLMRDTVFTGGKYRDMIIMSKLSKFSNPPLL